MRGVACALVRADVAEVELREAVALTGARADARDGEEDEPRDEPGRKQHARHHAQEAHEEVRVEPVRVLDVAVVRAEHSVRPEENVWGERRGAPAGGETRGE